MKRNCDIPALVFMFCLAAIMAILLACIWVQGPSRHYTLVAHLLLTVGWLVLVLIGACIAATED